MTKYKTIIFVRHSESTNNVSKRTAARTWGLPRSLEDTKNILSLLTIPMDSSLSEEGLQMLEIQRVEFQRVLQEQQPPMEVVLYSPLQRAKQTAISLCKGLPLSISTATDTADPAPLPLELSEHIYEKSLSEYLGYKSFPTRVHSFVAELQSRHERNIVVVGHSMFFQTLVPEIGRQKQLMGNLSVWRAALTAEGSFQDVCLLVHGWRSGLEAGKGKATTTTTSTEGVEGGK